MSKDTSSKEPTQSTRSEDRQIIFTFDQRDVILPLDAYEPGDIKETKQKLSKELNCSPEDIRVRITGIRDGRIEKGSPIKIRLFDEGMLRNFLK